MRPRTQLRGVAAAIACAGLGACSWPQLYAVGQQWQRSECRKTEDRAERTRCEQSSALPYESYKAQAVGPKP